MKAAIAVLVVALVSPASTADFVAPAQTGDLAAAEKAARTLREKFRPAAVDPRPVKILSDRLIEDGEQVETEQGTSYLYTRIGEPDARGPFKSLQANLIEIPAERVETPGDSMVHRAVMRGYFSHLEAMSESWEVQEKSATGQAHVWIYKVSLDGVLWSVEHRTAPLEPGVDGRPAPVEEKARSERLPPADPSVQRRWQALTKELLTLGRVVEA